MRIKGRNSELLLNPLRGSDSYILFPTGLNPWLFRLNPFRISTLEPRMWFNLNNPVRSAG
jgi:hypothetical protein